MTLARIEDRFAELGRAGRAGFIPYVMAGDPDRETCARILEGLPGAGADLIELGMPFSDPMADGPVVQAAGLRALAGGMKLSGVLDLVAAFRRTDLATPVVLMGYLNVLLAHGLETFVADAAAAGVDGVIVVDCPPEEAPPLARAFEAHALALIRLATPTTDPARLTVVAAGTQGFIYYVSMTGVTGVGEADAEAIAAAVGRVRSATGLPVAVGFGVRTPERAAQIARVADAAVVGSALVEVIATASTQKRDPVAKVLDTVAAMAQAVRAARN